MSMERSTRARLNTVAVLALVLGAGVVVGMALGPRLLPGEEVAHAQDPRGGGPRDGRTDQGSQRRRPLIVEQVGLSAEQKTTVDSIVASHREKMRSLQDEFDQAYMPRYRGILEEAREAIRGVLTSDQRTEYDSLFAAHDRRMQERRARDSISGSRR